MILMRQLPISHLFPLRSSKRCVFS